MFLEAEIRAEEVINLYDDLVVGLTHSRGVNRVMPIEPNLEALEGVSSLTQRGEL